MYAYRYNNHPPPTHTYSQLLTTLLFILAHFLPPVCTRTSHSYTWAPPCIAAHCPHTQRLSHMGTSMHTYKHTYSLCTVAHTYCIHIQLLLYVSNVHRFITCQTRIYTHSHDSITYQLVLWRWGLRTGSGPALLGDSGSSRKQCRPTPPLLGLSPILYLS